MERRLIIFAVLAFAILVGHSYIMQRLYPPKPRPAVAQAGKEAGEKTKPGAAKADEKPEAGKSPAASDDKAEAKKPPVKPENEKPAPAVKGPAEPEPPEQWITLGSVDPDDPYRMEVTLTNKGAALERIELSSLRYCDIDDRSGYLGHLNMDDAGNGGGCLVQVVGPGTPAAKAGLKPGDRITALNGQPVTDQKSLDALLERTTKPKRPVELTVLRDGKQLKEPLKATLRRRPLEVVRPEGNDPPSMLLTLEQFEDQKIADEEKKEADARDNDKDDAGKDAEALHERTIRRELPGVKLRTANWNVVPSKSKDEAVFRRALPELGLEITKTYRLERVPDAELADADFPAYHLTFEIDIRNTSDKARTVAYRLDGPNGLPTEGKWYAYKVSRNWGGAGLRDVVMSFGGDTPGMDGASAIAAGKPFPVRADSADKTLTYVGVDAQYFSAVLLPQRANPADLWFDNVQPIRVGPVEKDHLTLTNTSCRLTSVVTTLAPSRSLVHEYRLFAGPKKPALLADKPYRLGELVYFGWPIFAWVAVPLTSILHGFYAVTFNYGLAIILLTVLVRGMMFPISLKQAHGAQKMQLLQPELKKLQEKYKNNPEGRARAQQELFQKHNYNPLSGCLPLFIQMPVFIGLWRSLSVAIELRDAPLFSPAIRWCSNLSAPDMLVNWSGFWHRVGLDFVNGGMGIFALGPYFNLLPILASGLLIWQQKKMMPVAADEQARMQQKIMQYMMIFMGLAFYKVGSGLCIYFIASSLWGLAERRFLPKPVAVATTSDAETRAEAKARARLDAEAARARKGRAKK